MHTVDSWWIEPSRHIQTGLAYNNVSFGAPDYNATNSMQDFLANALTSFANTYDLHGQFVNPGEPYNEATLDQAMSTAITNTASFSATDATNLQNAWNVFTANKTGWYWRMFKNSTQLDIQAPAQFLNFIGTPQYVANFLNKRMGGNISVETTAPMTSGIPILSLFELFHNNGDTIGDLFKVLGLTVPQVLTGLLFGNASITSSIQAKDPFTGQYSYYSYGPEPGSYNARSGGVIISGSTSYNPAFGSIYAQSILLVVVIIAFIFVFLLLAITKGTVRINRREFLGREDVQRNINAFIKQVEQLGGKVSVQNAEALVIRAFRTLGKIEKAPDVERRAKSYVENQKLLVTLQSRASRAYVAQKFKDCIAAIEKMIDIARKL